MARSTPNPSDRSADPAPTAARPRGGAKRVTRRLVVMSSAAILAVYAAGYLKTESAAESAAPRAGPTAIAPIAATPTTSSTSSFLARSSAVDTPVATAIAPSGGSPSVSPTAGAGRPAAPAPTATPAAGYRDGTYTGTGSSRHGDVQATVVIRGGKIVSANVDGCQTRYPCSVIQDLPGEVVRQQSANVDFISGASDSSSAYQEAVASALSQAS
ncbi:MAG: FMN-binding protein [Chloroflexota bacterium]